MPCVSLTLEDNETLSKIIQSDPSLEISIDLEENTVTCGGTIFTMDMPNGAREALINGKWDTIGELADNAAAIDATAATLGYIQ